VQLKKRKMTARSEIKDNLGRMILQRPNSRFLGVPFKLGMYNRHYNRLHMRDTLPKSVERPVITDTALAKRSMQNMKTYLYNQGYFYAKIRDTIVVRHKRAFVTYSIDPGINYLINNVNYVVGDSEVAHIIRANSDGSVLTKGKEFRYNLLEDERNRIAALLRNKGYYKFTPDNVNFYNGMDTVDKTLFKNAESPFEGAINFALEQKEKKKNTMDITCYVQLTDDSAAFTKFTIGAVQVLPDYRVIRIPSDSGQIIKKEGGIFFRYRRYYVHPHVLYEHIYLYPGNLYSQSDVDKTKAKLTELGIFQYANPVAFEHPGKPNTLDYSILATRTRKHDFFTSYQVSSGSTYFLGNSLSVNFRDRNLLKGANLLTIGVNAGVELAYNDNLGGAFTNRFSFLTWYYGANGNVDFPKFLAPVASSLFTNSNLPHTIIGGGENVIDRINYFTLMNTSANFTYNWKESSTKTWTLTPGFVNKIHLPVITPSFDSVLAHNAFLRNSYKENFIEGENISYTFDNIEQKRNVNYSFFKGSFEEAGALLSGINKFGTALNDIYKLQYAQYFKFDFDVRHYFTYNHAVVAMRFLAGIGVPYGQSTALPYIKQYFAGGPYSLRGWRIRTLGPGSFYDPTANNANQIDRTGDIKLEYNTEFRFPITPLFAGAVKMNGAIFADAGNIWLAHSDPGFPGGEFSFSTLGRDIAADVGAGTRFEIASFLTLRVDVAMPVRKPYVINNGGWVFNEIAFSDRTWRSNNVVFNISVGYPF